MLLYSSLFLSFMLFTIIKLSNLLCVYDSLAAALISLLLNCDLMGRVFHSAVELGF